MIDFTKRTQGETKEEDIHKAMEYEALRPFSYKLIDEEFVKEVNLLLEEKFPELSHDEQSDAISLALCIRQDQIKEYSDEH